MHAARRGRKESGMVVLEVPLAARSEHSGGWVVTGAGASSGRNGSPASMAASMEAPSVDGSGLRELFLAGRRDGIEADSDHHIEGG